MRFHRQPPAGSPISTQEIKMSNRPWFYASNGQQQGPFPEAQLRDLITRGTVRPDTLVWTEGMSGWQRASDIPGLVPGGSGPSSMPQPGGPPPMAAGGYGGGALAADLGVWPLLGRSLLFIIGTLLIIPAPWTATSFYRWIVSRLYVPERPNLAFTGQVGDIWYVFVAIGILTYLGASDLYYLEYLSIPIQAVLSWMVIRWIASNLSSNGQKLPIAFEGSALGYVGWQVLMYLSIITIVGWAWVITAWMRWICRNISGTRREVIFIASGLEVLWRTIVFAIGCAFIIPIPWVLRWYARWYVSQFALVDRTA
jgi:GYF domain 2